MRYAASLSVFFTAAASGVSTLFCMAMYSAGSAFLPSSSAKKSASFLPFRSFGLAKAPSSMPFVSIPFCEARVVAGRG